MNSEHSKQIHVSGIHLSFFVEYNADPSVQTNSKLAFPVRRFGAGRNGGQETSCVKSEGGEAKGRAGG